MLAGVVSASGSSSLSTLSVSQSSTNVLFGRVNNGVAIKSSNVNVVLGNQSDRINIRQSTINIVVEP